MEPIENWHERGLAALARGELDTALAALRSAAEQTHSDTAVTGSLRQLAVAWMTRYYNAVDNASATSPADAMACCVGAIAAYRAMGTTQEAEEDRQLLAAACFGRAVGEAAQGREEAAITFYREATVLYPEEGSSVVNAAYLLLQLGRGSEAVEMLQAAVVRHPGQTQLHGNLVNALQQAGRFDDAVAAAKAAATLHSGLRFQYFGYFYPKCRVSA
jgi:tetratricopeptide (TPR) repeat protein